MHRNKFLVDSCYSLHITKYTEDQKAGSAAETLNVRAALGLNLTEPVPANISAPRCVIMSGGLCFAAPYARTQTVRRHNRALRAKYT